ncbi:sugar transferase [Sulfitobacter sp. 1A15258]|uniref:sugar transferase n=1 Tax=Sulfitobacter sp. 1A15258 TaxID=3368588 RepID=UPI003746EF45
MKHQVTHSPVAVGARSFPSRRSGTAYARWGKRTFDIALPVILLPVLLSVILVLAGVVALDGGAPFFGHRRVGKGGRGFRCWKIRTMVADAQEHLVQYLDENPVAVEEWTLKL